MQEEQGSESQYSIIPCYLEYFKMHSPFYLDSLFFSSLHVAQYCTVLTWPPLMSDASHFVMNGKRFTESVLNLGMRIY